MGQTHYIFVDCENVRPRVADIALLKSKPVHVTLVLGQQDKSLCIDMVKKLLQYADQVELVESKTSGKNALDLILVSHLGIRGRMDPGGAFHIIAKDKDYKPVVAHFRSRGWSVFQHDSMAKVPVLKSEAKAAVPDNHSGLLARLCEAYRSNRLNQPKTKRALQSQIQSSFSPRASNEDALMLIQGLVDFGVVVITTDDKLEFTKPDEAGASSQAMNNTLCLAASAS